MKSEIYNPLISIVLPVYNGETFIEETLISIYNQTFKNYELIIIDDGSTDNTQKNIESVCNKLGINYLYRFQDNKGLSIARNVGLEMSCGKYVAFVDGDDILDENYLKQLINSSNNLQADIVIGGFETFNSDTGKIIGKRQASNWTVNFNIKKHTFQYSACAKLFRIEFLRKYDIKFSEREQLEDGPFSMMTDLISEQVVVTDYIGYKYRKHDNSITSDFRKGNPNTVLPYRGIEDAIIKTIKYTPDSYKMILEFCFVKELTGLTTNICKNMDVNKREELSEYCYYILDKYFPKCYKNKYIRKVKIKNLPFKHLMAMKLFSLAYKHRKIYEFSLFVSKRL